MAQRLAAHVGKALPPGPRGRRLLGSLLDVRRDKLRFVSRAARQYGDIVLFRMGPSRQLYLLSHPDPVEHVLQRNAGNYVKGIGLQQARVVLGDGILTSQGELWATQRDNLRHLFGRQRLEAHAGSIAQAAADLTGRWKAAAEAGQPVDVSREAVRLTLDVLGRIILGVDLNGLEERLTTAFDEVVRCSMRRMTALLPLPVSVPTPGNVRCRRAVRELEALADLIVSRRSQASGEEGFLSALLAARDWNDGEEKWLLRQELLSLLLAGHETTATALSWCCHLLAAHPETQRRMREEVTRVLPGGTLPTAADLQRLPYTRMVLEETLRLYPAVWMITRRAIADDRIGGYEVSAGSDILISVYNLHRHARFWEYPEEFHPERFAADQAQGRPSSAYLPFGAGPRACLGRGLAFLEVLLTLPLIVRAFELSPAPGRPVEPEPLLTLRPLNGLFLRLSINPLGLAMPVTQAAGDIPAGAAPENAPAGEVG